MLKTSIRSTGVRRSPRMPIMADSGEHVTANSDREDGEKIK
jgi:hypothetical protein